MLENMMTARYPIFDPARFLQLSDQVIAFHGGYYIYQMGLSRTGPANWDVRPWRACARSRKGSDYKSTCGMAADFKPRTGAGVSLYGPGRASKGEDFAPGR
jgi:hypothetical protein